MEPIIPDVNISLIEAEIEALNNHKLLSISDYDAYFAPSGIMPNIMRQIYRMREITFREVGEGTGKSADSDKYDKYYYHLFIWNTSNKNIVGAYRIGFGREIMPKYGIKGFYVTSLFELRESVWHMLYNTLELGRSFITKEYQKKVIPLYLLWKSLLVILLTNKATYLLGPVSMSGTYSDNTKALIIAFLKQFYYDELLAFSVINRYPLEVTLDKSINIETFLKETEGDFNKLDKFIKQSEPDYITPVLLRQYLSQLNAKVIGFNIDPLFSNCLDSLVLLNFNDVPRGFLESISKDFEEKGLPII